MASSKILRTEQWFVRQGAPTMIEGYGFRSHVLPRMLPALTFVAVGSLAWLVLLSSIGLSKWVLLGVVVAVMVSAWILLSLFVRRLPSFSRRTTVLLLIGYAAMPVIVPLLQYVIYDQIITPGTENPSPSCGSTRCGSSSSSGRPSWRRCWPPPTGWARC